MTTLSPPPAPASPAADRLTEHRFADRDGDTPLRCELYGPELLEAHARCLAGAARATRLGGGVQLLRRLERNARALRQAQQTIAAAYRQRQPIGPDAEWLFDNFHIVADALREVRTDLPGGYYKKLPK